MVDHPYEPKTLVGILQIYSKGNWYEDRLIGEQAFKKYPNEFIVLFNN